VGGGRGGGCAGDVVGEGVVGARAWGLGGLGGVGRGRS